MEVLEVLLTTLGGGTAIWAAIKGALKYATTRMEIYKEQSRIEREEDRRERAEHNKRLLAQIDKSTEANRMLLETNMKLAENCHVITHEHSQKIDSIENNVLVMNEKMNSLLARDKVDA